MILLLMLLILTNSQHVFAGEWNKTRDLAVDKELSEMEKASVILPPGKHTGGNLHPKTGQISGMSPSDTGATAKSSSAGISGAGTSGGDSSGTNLQSGPTDLGGNIDANLNAGIGSSAGIDADLTTGTGGTVDNSTGDAASPPDTGTDFTEEIPTVGGDVSTGGDDYLINVDASVGETEVNANLIPSDSFDDTLIVQTTDDIGAEIDASGDLSGSEAEIGIEADVDGSVSGDDIASDPADGLPLTPTF